MTVVGYQALSLRQLLLSMSVGSSLTIAEQSQYTALTLLKRRASEVAIYPIPYPEAQENGLELGITDEGGGIYTIDEILPTIIDMGDAEQTLEEACGEADLVFFGINEPAESWTTPRLVLLAESTIPTSFVGTAVDNPQVDEAFIGWEDGEERTMYVQNVIIQVRCVHGNRFRLYLVPASALDSAWKCVISGAGSTLTIGSVDAVSRAEALAKLQEFIQELPALQFEIASAYATNWSTPQVFVEV